MNDTVLKIAEVHKKIESNKKMQSIMKIAAALNVICVMICAITDKGSMRMGTILSMFFIVAVFMVDVYYGNKNKKCEMEIYELMFIEASQMELDAKDDEQKSAAAALKLSLQKPSEEMSMPTLLYALMMFADFLIRILLVK